LWDEDLPESSLILPRWGLMRDGVLSELMKSARPTGGNAAGLWPAPNVPNGGRSCQHVTEWSESGKTAFHNGKKVQIGLEHAAKYWPTPTVCGNNNRNGASANSGDGLATAVKLWSTPTSTLGTKGGLVTPRKSREGGTLIEAISNRQTWPTPTASLTDIDTMQRQRLSGQKRQVMKDCGQPYQTQTSGSLNPTWVEWLMGWPLGWTDLKPLEMDKCPSAPPTLGES
jgi:hypothetical protein